MGVWIETIKPWNPSFFAKSHPAWVCGLKPERLAAAKATYEVTPCVGVWIETLAGNAIGASSQSHPAWVCGLKQVFLFCYSYV